MRGPEGVERVAGGWRVWLSFVGVAVRLGFGRSLSRRPSHNPDREQEQAGHDGVGRAHGRCTGMIRLTVGSSTGRSYRLALPGQDAKGLLQRGVGGTAVGAPTPSRPERGPLRIAEVVIDAIHPTLAPASGSRPATPGHHRHPSAGTPACGSSSPRRKEMTISLVMADPGCKSHRPLPRAGGPCQRGRRRWGRASPCGRAGAYTARPHERRPRRPCHYRAVHRPARSLQSQLTNWADLALQAGGRRELSRPSIRTTPQSVLGAYSRWFAGNLLATRLWKETQEPVFAGGRDRDRTCDFCRVKRVRPPHAALQHHALHRIIPARRH